MPLSTTEITSLFAAGLALVGSLGSGLYTYANHNRELDIRLVEIGIGILRADPKATDIKAARAWALQVIEQYSNVPFSQADKAALLENPLIYTPSFAAVVANPGIVRDSARDQLEIPKGAFERQEGLGGVLEERKRQ